jgi:hypothetical protein
VRGIDRIDRSRLLSFEKLLGDCGSRTKDNSTGSIVVTWGGESEIEISSIVHM